MGGAYAQDPQGWKRPWELWGWGLGSRNRRGPRCALHPWSQRAGDLTWAPSRLPGFEWAGQMPSSPAPPVWGLGGPLPPASPAWSSGPPSYAPRTNAGRGGQKGGPWRAGEWPGSSIGSPCPSGRGNCPLFLSHSSPRAPPACLS